MSELIGPFELLGTDAQNAILRPMAEKMAATLLLDATIDSYRVDPTHVRILPRDKMPWARRPGTEGPNDDGVRARGFWDAHRFPDDILLADDLFGAPDGSPELARKTLAHEVAHQLDDQWMLRPNRKEIKPLFDPDAAGWPSEEFAVYGSAAIFNFTNPPYKTYYKDFIVRLAQYPELKAAALADHHPVIVEPPPVEPPVDPPPVAQVIEVPGGTSIVVKAI